VEWHGEGGAWGGAVSATGALRWQELGARLDLAYEAQQVNVRTLFQQMENFDQTTLRSEHISGLLDSEGTLLFPWKSNGSVDWDRVNWQGNQTLRSATLENVEALMSIPDYLSEHRMAAPLIHPDDLRSKLRFVALHPIQIPIYFFQSAFHIPSYVFKTDDLHVSLEGVHGLSGEMDYSVGIELRELRAKTSDDIGEVADDGLGNHLFIKMSGTFEALNYAWDREAQRAHRRKDFQAEGEKLRALWLRNRTE
jgi:hypothetical protein